MNKFKTGKKFLALVLALLVAFSGISVYAADLVESVDVSSEPVVCHDHIYSDWKISVQPTCQTEGKKYRTCENCGITTEPEVMPADPNAHVPGEEKVIKAATCATPGVSEYVCQQVGCNNTTYRVETAELGHTFDKKDGEVIIDVVIEPEHIYKYYSNGKGYSDCTRCGVSVEQIIFVEHDFDGSTPDIKKAATCTEDGYMDTTCNVCDYSIRETIPANPKAHVFSGKAQLKDGVKFDCETDGEGIVICEKCNATGEIIIPKEKAHDYLEWKVEIALPENPICGEYGDKGSEIRYCDVCTEEIERRIIYAPHNFEEIGADGEVISHVTARVASTCCTRGYDVGNCLDCGQKDVKNYHDVDPDAHNYIEKVVTPSTCIAKGQLLRMCKYDASHFEYVDIELADHIYDAKWEIKEATCCEPGYKKNHCAVCGDINIYLPKDENAHNFSGQTWTVVDRAECGETGSVEAGCVDCGKTISKPLPSCYSEGANFKTVEPTCYSEGKTTYICKKCGQSHEIAIPIDDNAHYASVGYKIRKNATCTETGLETKYCEFCNADIKENQKIIPATPHTVKEVVDEYPQCAVNAGDFKLGSKHHECIYCDYKSESIEISATHNYTAWAVSEKDKDKTPNCMTPITMERVCYGCGHVDTDSKYYSNHVEVNWTFPEDSGEDCITGGVAVKKCTACGDVYDSKTIAAGNHTELVFVADTLTQTETECYGKVYKCVTCNVEVVVSKSHSFMRLEKGHEPTCVLPGLTDSKYCAVCKLKIEQKPLTALGHTYAYDSNGSKYCTRCNLFLVDGAISESCNHFCHNQSIVAKVLKMVSRFFWKLFGTSRFCKCGAPHYHDAKDKFNNQIVTIHSYKFDEKGKLSEIVYSCTECEVNKERYEF